jgi:hypothetical protein
MDVADYLLGIVTPMLRSSFPGFGGVLQLQPSHIGPDFGIAPVPSQEFQHPLAREAEQGAVNELDRGGGALDVQQDGADLDQVDAVRSGM